LDPEQEHAYDIPTNRFKKQPASDVDDFKILGVGNLLTQSARCCNPVPNDHIVGYITRGRGVTIHRSDCSNVLRLKETDRDRLIDVEWGGSPDKVFPVTVHVTAYDRQGLLRDISAVLANDKINLIEVKTRTDKKDMVARMELILEVKDISQLSRLLSRIGQLPNIIEVKRKM
jgi:GTP pyrophosphokinase